DRHDIESIKQILPEQSLPDRLSKVSVGGRNDPHIRADRRTAADGRVFALLQHTKRARLRIGWHVADLIEEQGAALRLLESARIALRRSGKRTALMAEELALDELARDRRHVDGDERTAPALAVVVEGARNQLLTGAALAGDHHGEVGAHEPREHAVDVLHRGRPA